MTDPYAALRQCVEAMEDAQRHRAYVQGIPDAITAARAALKARPEPVAWIDNSGYPHHIRHLQGVERRLYGPLRPLYAAPPQREPLTHERIVDLRDEHLPSQGEPFDCIAFARAVERAHAIDTSAGRVESAGVDRQEGVGR